MHILNQTTFIHQSQVQIQQQVSSANYNTERNVM